MKNLYIALCAICLASVTLTGCASDTRTPLDRVEFGPDECGTAEITGTVDLNGNPFVTTNVHLKVEKQKPCAVTD